MDWVSTAGFLLILTALQGVRSEINCTIPGTYNDGNDTCVPCPRGTYRSAGDNSTTSSQCDNCTDGKTTESVGSINVFNCSIDICGKGQELNESGVCVNCTYDFYQDIDLPTSLDRCKACPSNEATEYTKSTFITDCKRYCKTPGTELDDNGDCVLCPNGTYRAVDDRSMYFTACLNCTSGKTTENVGSTSIQNCSLGIPLVTLGQTLYSAITGQTVTITCTISASPLHTHVFWQREDNGVTSTLTIDEVKYSGSTVNRPSLTITNASSNDSAVYTCSATNTIGTGTSNQTTLEVIGDIPVVTVKHTTNFVYTSHTVTLDCSVSTDLPHTAIYWQRYINGTFNRIIIDGKKYKGATVNFPSLIITNAEAGDQTVYRCSAINVIGTGTSTNTTLIVIGSLPVVTISQRSYSASTGSTVALGCIASANPTLTDVIWHRINNGIHQSLFITGVKYSGSTVSSPSLVISNTSVSDVGIYLCSATNAVGTRTSPPINLIISGDIPVVAIDQTDYTAIAGRVVILRCMVSADPNPTSISWLRTNTDDKKLTLHIDGIKYGGSDLCTPFLTILDVEESDAGIYQCSVTNAVGTATSDPITLQVIGVPVVTVPQEHYMYYGQYPITLDCIVSGRNITSVFWRRINNGRSSIIFTDSNKYQGSSLLTPSLTINNLNFDDSGEYICLASNAAGTGTSTTIWLSVYGSPPTVHADRTNYSVMAGNPVTLTCHVSAYFTEIWWLHNQYHLSLTVQTLTISSTTMCDEGEYRCCARNSFGMRCSSLIQVAVQKHFFAMKDCWQ